MSSEASRGSSWGRFRAIYRDERTKVKAESSARNPYTFWLGFIAILGMLLGAIGAANGSVSPAMGIGVLCGVAWLVAKAVTSQRQPPA